MILALASREPMKRRPGVGTRRPNQAGVPDEPAEQRQIRLPECDRERARAGIRHVVVSAGRVVDTVAPAACRPPFEPEQLRV